MSLELKPIVKGAYKKIRSYGFHRDHAHQVSKVLPNLEPRYGKLDPCQKRVCDNYAVEVLGHRRYAPWLYVYTLVAGRFKQGWIPDNYYGAVVLPAIKGEYQPLSEMRAFSSGFFRSEAFPDIARYANGLFFTSDFAPISPRFVKDLLFKNTGKVVFKVDNSSKGRGIFFFTPQDFDLDKVKQLGNGVFQSFIVQHPSFEAFAHGAIATLRLTTVVDDNGAISLRAGFFRLARNGDTHVQSTSALRIPVDIPTGSLGGEGFAPNWHTFTEHPDSKLRFSGYRIPAFSRCVSAVIDLHKKVPFIRCIGWDVTVDANEQVKVMEWNGAYNDIKFTEATQGPCFADLGWEKLARNLARS